MASTTVAPAIPARGQDGASASGSLTELAALEAARDEKRRLLVRAAEAAVSTLGTIAGAHLQAISTGPPAGVDQCPLTSGCGITHVVRRLAPRFPPALNTGGSRSVHPNLRSV